MKKNISQLQSKTIQQFFNSYQIDNISLSKYDMSNMFSVVDCGQNSYYNISNTIRFSNTDYLSNEYYQYHKISQGQTWTNISYTYYKTIKLWWLICKFNNIINPFTELTVGKIIKIPSKTFANQILNSIK